MDPENIEEVEFIEMLDRFDNDWGIWLVNVRDALGNEVQGTMQGDGISYNVSTFEEN